MIYYNYHHDGTLPKGQEIFVFGSNLSGIHGAGAARVAREQFGAEPGIGSGFTGTSYAIPTKSKGIQRTLTLEEIRPYIEFFVKTTISEDGCMLDFFVTRVGCGLAGYEDHEIAPLFRGAGPNCNFPDQWREYLEQH